MAGSQPSFGDFGSPGFVSPFDMHAVSQGQGSSIQAMTNRYAQLGLSGTGATPHSPGGPAGGIGVGNIGASAPGSGAPGTAPPVTAGETTAEMMDLGQSPSLGGGIPAQFEAIMGMIQNANLANASMSGGGGGGGGKGGGGGGKGAMGALMPLMMK